MKKKKKQRKKVIKIDKVDCYIQRYRENLNLQDELERKRKSNIFDFVFRRRSS